MKGSTVSVGVRTHSAHGSDEGGWATYVVLGGPISAPHILVRGRMPLCDSKVEGSNQPFHRAGVMFPFHRCEPMDFKTAEAFVARCRKSSQDMAARALKDIASTHGALTPGRILSGPQRSLPSLQAILASHALMHAAEREFSRDAARDAAVRNRITTEMMREKDLPALAKQLPGTDASKRDTLKAFGKQVGSPWAQDEKFAATAAWLGLA